jgi:hypothetical protein
MAKGKLCKMYIKLRKLLGSRRYQIFGVVGLERGPLSLVSTTEKLTGRNSNGSGLETGNTAVGIRHAGHATPVIRKTLELTSLTSGSRSVGIVRSRSKATELLFIIMRYARLETLDCRSSNVQNSHPFWYSWDTETRLQCREITNRLQFRFPKVEVKKN